MTDCARYFEGSAHVVSATYDAVSSQAAGSATLHDIPYDVDHALCDVAKVPFVNAI